MLTNFDLFHVKQEKIVERRETKGKQKGNVRSEYTCADIINKNRR